MARPVQEVTSDTMWFPLALASTNQRSDTSITNITSKSYSTRLYLVDSILWNDYQEGFFVTSISLCYRGIHALSAEKLNNKLSSRKVRELTENPLRPAAHNQKSQLCLNNLTEANPTQINWVDSKSKSEGAHRIGGTGRKWILEVPQDEPRHYKGPSALKLSLTQGHAAVCSEEM